MSRSMYYILVDHCPVPEPDVLTWAQWYERHDQRIARTRLSPSLVVSTVFLGLNHALSPESPAMVFETMVFDANEAHPGNWHMYQERYPTWDEAAAGHARIVTAIQEGQVPHEME